MSSTYTPYVCEEKENDREGEKACDFAKRNLYEETHMRVHY